MSPVRGILRGKIHRTMAVWPAVTRAWSSLPNEQRLCDLQEVTSPGGALPGCGGQAACCEVRVRRPVSAGGVAAVAIMAGPCSAAGHASRPPTWLCARVLRHLAPVTVSAGAPPIRRLDLCKDAGTRDGVAGPCIAAPGCVAAVNGRYEGHRSRGWRGVLRDSSVVFFLHLHSPAHERTQHRGEPVWIRVAQSPGHLSPPAPPRSAPLSTGVLAAVCCAHLRAACPLPAPGWTRTSG